MGKTRHARALVAGAGVVVLLAAPRLASADPVASGSASAFAVTAALNGTEVIPPTPASATPAPAADEASTTVVDIPGDPLAVSGTLIARTAVHAASDLPSLLEQSTQAVTGPYNARAVGQVEDLNVLINDAIPGGQLLSADLLRGEAVAVCKAGSVSYAAQSEVVNLHIADQDPISGPLNDAITQITEAISASPLAGLVDVDANVVTTNASGAAVDALVVTVLAAAGDTPVAQVRIGHAEVSGVGCGTTAAAPQCSDQVDNADAEDVLADAQDPGCHTDGDATNAATYDPNDNDETNTTGPALPKDAAADVLPVTGAAVPAALAAGLGIAALALLALRRRVA